MRNGDISRLKCPQDFDEQVMTLRTVLEHKENKDCQEFKIQKKKKRPQRTYNVPL